MAQFRNANVESERRSAWRPVRSLTLLASDTESWPDATSVAWVNDLGNPYGRWRSVMTFPDNEQLGAGFVLAPGAEIAGESIRGPVR